MLEEKEKKGGDLCVKRDALAPFPRRNQDELTVFLSRGIIGKANINAHTDVKSDRNHINQCHHKGYKGFC